MLRYVMRSLGGGPLTCLSMLGAKTQDETDDFTSAEELTGLENVWIVWFNPWQYQNEQNPVIPVAPLKQARG